MQPRPRLAQPGDCLDADVQVLGNRAFVKAVGLAGQLDLAMQRLVRYAEQRAIGHPEAVTLGGDGGGFHVDGDGAGLVEAQRRAREAQLPVAIIGGHHGAGAQPRLERLAMRAGDSCGGILQGELHFRQRRDGNFRRQHVIEHMIVAQIGMGQHIIADRLAGAQAAAMADHQPGLGTQHGEMVTDGLGVGRADADVDQRDADAAGGGEVPGRHLELAPGAVAGSRLG